MWSVALTNQAHINLIDQDEMLERNTAAPALLEVVDSAFLLCVDSCVATDDLPGRVINILEYGIIRNTLSH